MLKTLIKSGLTKSLFFFFKYGRAIYPNPVAKAFVLIKRKNSDCDDLMVTVMGLRRSWCFSPRRSRL